LEWLTGDFGSAGRQNRMRVSVAIGTQVAGRGPARLLRRWRGSCAYRRCRRPGVTLVALHLAGVMRCGDDFSPCGKSTQAEHSAVDGYSFHHRAALARALRGHNGWHKVVECGVGVAGQTLGRPSVWGCGLRRREGPPASRKASRPWCQSLPENFMQQVHAQLRRWVAVTAVTMPRSRHQAPIQLVVLALTRGRLLEARRMGVAGVKRGDREDGAVQMAGRRRLSARQIVWDPRAGRATAAVMVSHKLLAAAGRVAQYAPQPPSLSASSAMNRL